MQLRSICSLALLLAAGPGVGGERQLIADPHFQLGCNMLSPVPGKVVVVETVRLTPTAKPVWRLAQWHSKHSLEGVPLQTLEPGVFRLANQSKSVIWASRDHADGELVLAVTASNEYDDHPRRQGEQWPHFLLSQRFQHAPRLVDVQRADFGIAVRLLKSVLHRTDDYTPNLHAAQFQVFFNIQNLNRKSAGYGDYLYFGIPLYDSRYRVPHAFKAPDQVSKFIFTPAGDTYTDESVHDGQWVTVKKDLLPLFRQALKTAWDKGFLKDSDDEADYCISAMNLGWEVPGTLDVAIQTRDLHLTLTLK
jgi:hypothetical protein